jgi:RNA polymerase sigma-54 factor
LPHAWAPPGDRREVLRVVQGFEPTGVGARDLAECLALQLRELDRCDPAMEGVLANLELWRDATLRVVRAVRRRCRRHRDMIAEIRALTPKPGLAFGAEPVQPSCRMCSCAKAPTALACRVERDTLPRLLINSRYYREDLGSSRDKDAPRTISPTASTTRTGW